ncbi:Alpha/Beta hydrolase protein [Tribonema minus]|uniref:Alpha/Beta hydrolase protein n=1 Tax=Tribonema minus TaxID=303371 RepID=A0A835ZEV4_9STRA|nr:Alpha/Beta hydrolase protein [Tribonema minus]
MVRSWWVQSSLLHLEEAERRLLLKTGMRAFDTEVGDDLTVHALEGGSRDASKPPLVLCHGYGQGAAAFALNFPHLTANLHVYAKDWMGYGQSSRPKFTPKGVDATEEHFIKYMERWRDANKVQRMILCGHSLGGYLSVAYAERYPERVAKLILVSPVGVPHRPEEFTNHLAQQPWGRRTLLNSAAFLWSRGVTPGDLVRGLGPIGRRLMDGYAQRRFKDGGELDRTAFGEYLYHNAAATAGSGERALSELLLPYAWAKSPLHDRIPKLSRTIPIHFVYGEVDWMDHRHALKVREQMVATHTVTVETIAGAGHQVFIDEPSAFNDAILRLCDVHDPIPAPISATAVEAVPASNVQPQAATTMQ